jgi:signal transduction histidine kinase
VGTQRILCFGLAAATLVGSATADQEPRVHRLVRVYDWASGVPWSYVASVEQDRHGFLWLSATSGLYRFDGTRAIRVSAASGLAGGSTAAGRVIVYSGETGHTYEATPEGLVTLDDAEAHGSWIVAVASDGMPWRVHDGVVERLDERTWTAIPVPAPAGDPPRYVRPGRDGRMYITTMSKVFLVEPQGSSRLLAEIARPLVVVELEDGRVLVGANQDPGPVTTRVFEIGAGGARAVFEEQGSRLMSIAERGDKLWVSMDRALQALGPRYVRQDRVSGPAIPATGSVIVDHEGSLWMATSGGLVQIPEPDVYTVQPSGGGVLRDLARNADGAWGTFWGVLAFVADTPQGLRMSAAGEHYSILCLDGARRVWTAGGGGIQRLDASGLIGPAFSGAFAPDGCGAGALGRRWIVSGFSTLWTVAPEDERPRQVPVDLDLSPGLSYAAESNDGTLWLAVGAKLCGAAASDVLSEARVTWRCDDVPDGRPVLGLQAMPSGDVWGFTPAPTALFHRARGRFEVVPGFERLGVNFVSRIVPSPAGGVWLAGQGLLVRVGERADLEEGFEVLERPTVWNGLITLNVSDVAEDADGTLWLGTDVGIQKIPPEIRHRRPAPPAVELVEGSVNGEPLDAASPAELPYRTNRLDVRFAAMTYRDPAAVRYRMRLREKDAWSTPTTDGHFTFVDLPAGRYELQVGASLDGTRWSEPPARIAFDVPLPWYARPWLLGGAVVGASVLGHIGYRLRARRRLAREQQRTRIAMDLHDEVGSGLGTIAVLAGIAGRADLPEARRADVAGRIAAVSQELARSLGDIVWSLRTSSGALDALWNQLLDRARPLYASGNPRIAFDAPEPVPSEPLSLVVRRNLHLVVYEALHNASRHSGATIVTLRLARDGGAWAIDVEDDGRGLPADESRPSVRRGLGLEAMKARVAEMGGTISWDRGGSGGTRVQVRFRTGEG